MGKFAVKIVICILFCCLPFPAAGDDRPLRLVCDHWPPYQIGNGNQLSGFSVSLVKLVLRDMGAELDTIRVYPWKRALSHLKAGKADGLFSANFNPERTSFARYPGQTLVDSPWVLWARKGQADPDTAYTDLAGKTIGVVSGYTYTQEFWAFVKAHNNFDAVTSDEQNFRKLAAGRVDFAVAELGNGKYLKNLLKLDGIVPLTKHPVMTQGLYIIFSKQTVPEGFVDRFSDTLARVKATDAYARLYSNYFTPPRFDP
ncbi:MAG TPA: hypothetical protein DHV36_22290 [Desulfobacteraceae bacterium]|nr:hypothetical protein [Desulfobacteraceae bacterium]|tara:strand:+ start:378 stop:1148 length:771 start_codon:yes stop_codon:yes gene_type:complete